MYDCRYHKPKGVLADHVKCIWSLECDASGQEPLPIRVVPNGCVELCFYYGQPAVQVMPNHREPKPGALLCGQKRSFTDLEFSDEVGIVCVLFNPASFRCFFPVDANHVTGQFIDADNVVSASGSICEKLFEAHTPTERISIVEQYLMEIFQRRDTKADVVLSEAVRLLESTGGMISVDDITNDLAISARQLERKFSAALGLSPKGFARIVRFQNTLFLKQTDSRISNTQLAYAAGYSDQSHFSKEFKSITGLTPTRYFSQCPAFSDYYTFR